VIWLKLYVNIDGGSRGNPGNAAAAMVITDANGRVLTTKSKYLGSEKTNNFAEWSALAGAVRALISLTDRYGPIEAEVRSDSELVVRQFNRLYKIKAEDLNEIAQETWRSLEENPDLKLWLVHVYREDNKLADAAVNRELDRYK
jgi:ribonuclease HI